MKLFDNILQLVEEKMNNESLSCLGGISAKEALNHKPEYISMVWQSNKIKRRKYVKKEIESPSKILPKFTLVRIVKFKDKEMFKKESYGSLSEVMFVIIDYEVHDFITYYKLGNLFTCEAMFSCTFSFYEIKVVNLSYAFACYQAQLNIDYVIAYVNNDIVFKPKGYDTKILGPKRLLDY